MFKNVLFSRQLKLFKVLTRNEMNPFKPVCFLFLVTHIKLVFAVLFVVITEAEYESLITSLFYGL